MKNITNPQLCFSEEDNLGTLYFQFPASQQWQKEFEDNWRGATWWASGSIGAPLGTLGGLDN